MTSSRASARFAACTSVWLLAACSRPIEYPMVLSQSCALTRGAIDLGTVIAVVSHSFDRSQRFWARVFDVARQLPPEEGMTLDTTPQRAVFTLTASRDMPPLEHMVDASVPVPGWSDAEWLRDTLRVRAEALFLYAWRVNMHIGEYVVEDAQASMILTAGSQRGLPEFSPAVRFTIEWDVPPTCTPVSIRWRYGPGII